MFMLSHNQENKNKNNNSNFLMNIFDNIFSFLFKNDNFKTVSLILFHNIILFISFLYLIVGDVGLLYYSIIIFIILIIIVNYFLKGCPLIKLERKYLKNSNWYGAYHSLEFFGIKPDKKNIKTLFTLWGLMLLTIPIYRIIYS